MIMLQFPRCVKNEMTDLTGLTSIKEEKRMNPIGKWLLGAAVCCILLSAGCTFKPAVTETEGGVPSVPHAAGQATPEPTATPAPTPIPFDLAADASEPVLTSASAKEDIQAAASAENGADAYEAYFNADGYDAEPGDDTAPALRLDCRSDGASGGRVVVLNGVCCAISGNKLVTAHVVDDGLEFLQTAELGAQWSSGYTDAGEPAGSEDVPLRLYAYGDRLAVIYAHYEVRTVAGVLRTVEYTGIDLYEVSGAGAAQRLHSMGQSGSFLQAEISDGILTVMSGHAPEFSDTGEFPDDGLPSVITDGAGRTLAFDRIYLSDAGYSRSFTTVAAYSLNESAIRDAVSFFGFGDNVMLEQGSVYLWSRRWLDTVPENGLAERVRLLSECTDLYRLSLINGRFEANGALTLNGAVPGPGALFAADDAVTAVTALRQGYFLSGSEDLTVPEGQGRGYALSVIGGDMVRRSSVVLPTGAEQRFVASSGYDLVFSDGDTAQAIRVSAGPDGVMSAASAAYPAVKADIAAPWGDDSFLFFCRDGEGSTRLSVWGMDRGEYASRTFARDFYSSVDHPESYVILYDKNIIAFPAEDSYCVFRLDENGAVALSADVYSSGPAGGMSAALYDRYLFIAGSDGLTCYDTADWTEVEDAALKALRKR